MKYDESYDFDQEVTALLILFTTFVPQYRKQDRNILLTIKKKHSLERLPWY